MKQTANYQLNQWEQADRILMADFNADNLKVDGALAGLQTALAGKADSATVSALQTAVAKCGNCKIAAGSYTGTGTYGSSNPCTLTFAGKPMVVFVCGGSYQFFAVRGATFAAAHGTNQQDASEGVTWGDSSVKWNNSDSAYKQLNNSGTAYHYAALLTTEA